MVQLDQEVLGAQVAEKLLRGATVGAPGLAEDGYEVQLSVNWSCGQEGVSYRRKERVDVPTAFSSMIFWAFSLAADIVAGDRLREEENRLRRKEMVGDIASIYADGLLVSSFGTER